MKFLNYIYFLLRNVLHLNEIRIYLIQNTAAYFIMKEEFIVGWIATEALFKIKMEEKGILKN